MSIAGASDTLVRLLQQRLDETGGLQGYTVSALTTREVTPDLRNRIGLVLYRIDPGRSPRDPALPSRLPAGSAGRVLGLDLHYLLVVWGDSAEEEQAMLGRCMAILDAHAVLTGPMLSPDHAWVPGTSLQVAMDSLETEIFLRLWGGFGGPPQLSMPYLVRGALLT